MARTFEFVLQFVGCVTVTVSPNQIIIIIIIISIIIKTSGQLRSNYVFKITIFFCPRIVGGDNPGHLVGRGQRLEPR